MESTPTNKKMIIHVTSGVGKGKTEISAFDKALVDGGIGNYNLIYLSSIVPKNSQIKVKKIKPRKEEYGNKLYVVLSRCDQKISDKEAWAGLGWIQDRTGRGLFVEHKAENEKTVIRLIKDSLEDMRKIRPYRYSKSRYSTCGIKCKDKPVCAVVAAVYQSENWRND